MLRRRQQFGLTRYCSQNDRNLKFPRQPDFVNQVFKLLIFFNEKYCDWKSHKHFDLVLTFLIV